MDKRYTIKINDPEFEGMIKHLAALDKRSIGEELVYLVRKEIETRIHIARKE